MTENRATSETYVTDDGEAALRREVRAAEDAEATHLWRIDERDERTVIERTDSENEAFRAKLQEWRRTNGTPGYTGPRAAR